MALPQLSCHRDSLEPWESPSCLLLYKYINAGSGNEIFIMPSAYISPHQKLSGKVSVVEHRRTGSKGRKALAREVGEDGKRRKTSLMISTSFYKFYPTICASLMTDQKCSSRRAKAAIPTTPLKLPRGPSLQAS